MKTWDAFYPDVLPKVRLAPLPMVDHALRNACIAFCEKSKVLVSTLALIDSVEDQQAYPLPMAANTDLVEVLMVWFVGEKLTPQSRTFLDDKYDDWTIEYGTPEFFTSEDTANVILVPGPDTATTDAIKVKAAIKPGAAATGIDDWLFSRFRLELAAGALAELLSDDGKPWANAALAAGYRAKFDDAIATASVAANSGMVRSRPRFGGKFC